MQPAVSEICNTVHMYGAEMHATNVKNFCKDIPGDCSLLVL